MIGVVYTSDFVCDFICDLLQIADAIGHVRCHFHMEDMKSQLRFTENRTCDLQQIAHEIAHYIARVISPVARENWTIGRPFPLPFVALKGALTLLYWNLV
jgi:hypothetical protein